MISTVTVESKKDIRHTCNGSGKTPQTNADRIRGMSDEELAEQLLYYGFDKHCTNDPACVAMLDTNARIPEERCKNCALQWLKQTADEG